MVRVLSPYGAKLVIEGLLQYHRLDLAYRYLKSVYSPMLEQGTTLWETFTGGSRVHGWGAYPIWMYWKSRFHKQRKKREFYEAFNQSP